VVVRRDAIFDEDDLTPADGASDVEESGSEYEEDDGEDGPPSPPANGSADSGSGGDGLPSPSAACSPGGSIESAVAAAQALASGGLGAAGGDPGGSMNGAAAAAEARAHHGFVGGGAPSPTGAAGGSNTDESAVAAAPSAAGHDGAETPPDCGTEMVSRRYGRTRRAPKRYGVNGAATSSHGVTSPDKMSFPQARQQPDWPLLDAAVRAEVASLWSNGTWVLADLPPGAKTLPAQMLCERKRGADGEVSRRKRRFVACGNHQVAGRDFTDVWAPVARHATLRALLAMAASTGMLLYQLDVETAFLNGTVDEELYLQQPRGCERGEPGKVCRLVKAIYGLKQAVRAWYLKLVDLMTQMGMTQFTADAYLFTRVGEDGAAVYLLIYVNDILLIGKYAASIEAMKQTVTTAFASRDIGVPAYFLGLHIGRD